MVIGTWSVEYWKRMLNMFNGEHVEAAYIGGMRAILGVANAMDEEAAVTLGKVRTLHTALEEVRMEKNADRFSWLGTPSHALPDHHPHDGDTARPPRDQYGNGHSRA